MFTGIIEDVGKVSKRSSYLLSVLTKLDNIRKGDSVSVNGTCLTVTELVEVRKGLVLDFDFSPETKTRTNIGDMRVGSSVNLERALKVGDRFGGHIMTGHIEGTGRLLKRKREQNSWIYVVAVDELVRKYIMPKGSVGVDGISLTVVDSEPGLFSTSVIPFTMSHTNLDGKKIGDRINLEPDILSKYVEHLLGNAGSKNITGEFLRNHGFLQ